MRISGKAEAAPAAGRVEVARSILRMRQLRYELIEREIFADPAWDLLLDLYVQHHLGKPVTVSSACIAANVPTTTGLRWIRLLVARGWLLRREDPSDRRSHRVTLTEHALAALDKLFDAVLGGSGWRAASAA